MKRIIATALLVATTGSAIISGTASALDAAPATPASPAVSTTNTGASAMDPETQRLLTLLATSVLAQFAAQASTGTLKDFDPGPMMESALRGALDSGAVNKLIDRLVDQAGSSINANGTADNAALTPEMRALIKVALSGAVLVAKNEITRSLKEDLQPAPAQQAKPTPQPSSVLNKDEGRN